MRVRGFRVEGLGFRQGVAFYIYIYIYIYIRVRVWVAVCEGMRTVSEDRGCGPFECIHAEKIRPFS